MKSAYLSGRQIAKIILMEAVNGMTSQIVGAAPWDINASEPAYWGFKYTSYYREDPYRSSDHNPVITWVNLE